MGDGYSGLFGAFPFAFRRSGSWLFRTYVVASALAAAVLALFMLLSLVVLFGATAGVGGGTLTLSRAFYAVVGLLVVAPVVAPTLLVARRHRRGEVATPTYDRLLAVAGFLFLGSLYVALVVSMPECFTLDGERVCRDPPTGVFAPLVALLYALPRSAAVVPPLLAVGLMAAVHRLLR